MVTTLRGFCFVVLFVGAGVIATDPVPSPVHFPTDNVVPDPPKPKPHPPGVITKLNQGEWYIVGSDVELVWKAIPDGIVQIVSKPTPFTVAGKFAGGTGQADEERTYKDQFIYHVKPIGKGQVTLLGAAKGKAITSDGDIITQSLTVGVPDPIPPAPDPNPGPIVAKGSWVVVIADDAAPSVAQGQILDGPTLRGLKAAGKCRVYGSILDNDQITTKHYDQLLKDKSPKDKPLSAPAVIVLDSNGNCVLAAKLPTDESSLAKLLKGVIE